MTARREGRRFIAFLVTSGSAAVVNLVARYVLSGAMAFELAVAVAYLIAMTVAFLLARRYVFEPSGGSVRREYLVFGLVNAVAFVQVWLVSVGLERFLFPAIGFTWQADSVAHLFGVASPAISSYYGHKYFSFRPAE